ncbi:cyclic nucleotide-binding domain-containing protein [Paludibacterium sp. B53371]|uniref:cyclic nucleotide-binding domain-containing protein n=1 Tax=Paludibacterium sp. B53371 TaxID=2806263 RepID=UPI001C05E3CB|nr:cyclic nucleotide-binding domain-containing protein [Paludibacterium sp. B53371]
MDPRIEHYYRQHQLQRMLGEIHLPALQLQAFQAGECLLAQGQPVRYLQFFVAGRAKVVLPMANGRELLLCFYQPLQLFGDMEIFEPDRPASSRIEALDDCLCLSLSMDYVRRALIGDSVFLQSLSRSLGRKLGRVIQNSALNMLHPLEDRLASYLLATARQQGEDWWFSGNLSQIADCLGVSFRHLHRSLQAFCSKGWLIKQGQQYRLQDRAELARRAGGIYVIPGSVY